MPITNRPRAAYQCDVSDAEWEFCQSYLVLMKEDAEQRQYPLREVFNALRYIVRCGCLGLQFAQELDPLCRYTYMGMGRCVEIAYPQPVVRLSYHKPAGAPDGDAGDPYNGYDRFGRTVDMRWLHGVGDSGVLDRIQYGYDRASNRVWRRNLAASGGGQDQAWTYDGLYQVKTGALGTLNIGLTAIGGVPARDEAWNYDPTGNWQRWQVAAGGVPQMDQSRINNRDNQITQIDGCCEGIAYDLAGNTLLIPPDAQGQWEDPQQLVWDAWNRLVAVCVPGGAPLAVYAYDGLYRRTLKGTAQEVRHFYYNDQWKCIEERVALPPSSSSSQESSSSSSWVWPSSSYPHSSWSSLESRSSHSSHSSRSSYSSSYMPPSSSWTQYSSSYAPLYSSSSSSEEVGLLRRKRSKRGTRVARTARAAEPRGKRVALLAPEVAEEAQVVTQHVWGVRPGHRDESSRGIGGEMDAAEGEARRVSARAERTNQLILRDRATGAGTSSSSAEPLDERLWCLMDYYDPTAIVDNEGAVVERYRFNAFGLRAILDPEFAPRAASLYDWDFAFKGQFLDLESGYYNYGYRYYSPQLGRWLSRDPIGEAGGVNIYAMAGNCPLNTIDILGLASLGQYGADWLTSYAKPLKDLGDHWLGRALGVASLLLQGYECIVAVSNLLTRPECFDSVEVRGEWRGNVRSDVRSAISSCTGALSGSIAAITGNGFIVAAVTQAAALVAGFVSNYIDDSTIDSAFDLQPGPPLCCKNT